MQVFHFGGGRRSGMGCGMMGGREAGDVGAGACQVVEGRISPMGYCDLYAPRGRKALRLTSQEGPRSGALDLSFGSASV